MTDKDISFQEGSIAIPAENLILTQFIHGADITYPELINKVLQLLLTGNKPIWNINQSLINSLRYFLSLGDAEFIAKLKEEKIPIVQEEFNITPDDTEFINSIRPLDYTQQEVAIARKILSDIVDKLEKPIDGAEEEN